MRTCLSRHILELFKRYCPRRKRSRPPPPADLVVEWCKSPNRLSIGNASGGPEVIKVNNLAIKFGEFVFQEEAMNQHAASRMVDPRYIRVPRVYTYFRRDNVGYLVMEFMSGTPIGMQDIDVVARGITHLHSLTGLSPGVLDTQLPGHLSTAASKGISRCLLWPHCARAFYTKEDLEVFVRSRLVEHSHSDFDLSSTALALCHMDLAPRNLLRLADGGLAVLDWAYSGYWPRAFEIARLQMGADDDGFARNLVQQLKPLDVTENMQKECIREVSFNCERYHL